ncbi:MAG: hypothetical protein ACLTMG_07460 [Oscillospiraceae bacterium]
MENETYWVTYLNPFRIIKHTNESIKFSLDEINYVTYDSSILCRMIGTIVSIFQGAKVEYIICGDGAIAISRKNTSFTSNDLLLIYNDFLCKLLIGGIYVEAIDNKDIDIGNLHGKNMLWPVGFGESASSNMHARVRMKLANNMETILLDGASNTAKSIDDFIAGISQRQRND